MTTVAFLGTGTMGLPMARHLAQAGFTVKAWNRSRQRAESLAENGATICDDPGEAASMAVAERLRRAEAGGHGDEDMAANFLATAPSEAAA